MIVIKGLAYEPFRPFYVPLGRPNVPHVHFQVPDSTYHPGHAVLMDRLRRQRKTHYRCLGSKEEVNWLADYVV
jgi:hypothetical protein